MLRIAWNYLKMHRFGDLPNLQKHTPKKKKKKKKKKKSGMRPESDPEVLGCYGDAKDFRVNPAIGKTSTLYV